MKKFTKGFTLIELLVVIAIIGILSSVVLASLNTARSKGADSAIKANLANMRAQAEIIYDSNGSYSNLCTNGTIIAAMNAAMSASGATATSSAAGTASSATNVACHENGTAWAVGSPLKSATANTWCVDSTGASKQITSGVLAASTYVCP